MTRKVNAAGLSLIKSFEGFEPEWYVDAVGVRTIGYGHTNAAGNPKYPATKGLVLTEATATALLADDLDQYAAAVEKAVKVPLNDNQFAALVSFCYNVGAGALAKSTLVKKLNAGNYGAVPSELAKWNKGGGKVLKGLTRRRKAEADLFNTPSVGSKPPIPAPPKPAPPSPAPKPNPPVKPTPAPSTGFWAAVREFFAALFKR